MDTHSCRARSLTCLVLAICAICVPINAAAREAKGFKLADGTLILWGTSLTDAVTQSKGDCEKSKSDDETVDCKPPEPYDSAALFFYKDRFYHVSAFLRGPAVGASDSFGVAERSLTRALGGPDRDKRLCQNGFGAIFVNHYDEWKAGKVTVTLDDRGCYPVLNDDGIFGGYMEITYEPFAPPEKPKSPVEAPF